MTRRRSKADAIKQGRVRRVSGEAGGVQAGVPAHDLISIFSPKIPHAVVVLRVRTK